MCKSRSTYTIYFLYGGVTTVQSTETGHNANLQFNVANIERNADSNIRSNNVDISCIIALANYKKQFKQPHNVILLSYQYFYTNFCTREHFEDNPIKTRQWGSKKQTCLVLEW